MAVLVDELREYPHVRFSVKHWCHMVSDESFEELHAFAARLGIPRHRFQDDHYDLPGHLRAKAVALGAKAVLVGRAWAWAVAARGEAGVRHVLAVFKADIDTALGLTGQNSIRDVDRSALYEPGAVDRSA